MVGAHIEDVHLTPSQVRDPRGRGHRSESLPNSWTPSVRVQYITPLAFGNPYPFLSAYCFLLFCLCKHPGAEVLTINSCTV